MVTRQHKNGMSRWKIHHNWSKELNLVFPPSTTAQSKSSSQVKVLKKGNEAHCVMRDAAHVTEMLFHWWQSVLVLQEGSASPSSSAPCNACHSATALHPNSSTSLIYYVLCPYTRTGNWNIFSHLKCHHDFMNPIFRVTHSFPRPLTSKKSGRPSNPLSALYISLELLCHAALHKNLMKNTKCSTK